MPAVSRPLVVKFRDVVDRVAAAFREQREIEAHRAIRRYRHLLGVERESSPLNETNAIGSEKDISEDAYEFEACARAISHRAFERS